MFTTLRHRFRTVAVQWIERNAYRRLQQLDDRMLKDIGLSRSDIRSAVRHGRETH